MLAVIVLIVAVLAAVIVWPRLHQGSRKTGELLERTLTSNPAENPVYAAAISPDGKYLAYADFSGVFLRLLETGEIHSIPLPQGFCFR